jgi:hypothetical protein
MAALFVLEDYEFYNLFKVVELYAVSLSFQSIARPGLNKYSAAIAYHFSVRMGPC